MKLIRSKAARVLLALAVSPLLYACGVSNSAARNTAPVGTSGSTVVTPPLGSAAIHLNGKVHGGQQPVSGSSIYLFATGSSGYGGPSTSLLNTSAAGVGTDTAGNGFVTSDSNGNFTITATYSCGSPLHPGLHRRRGRQYRPRSRQQQQGARHDRCPRSLQQSFRFHLHCG